MTDRLQANRSHFNCNLGLRVFTGVFTGVLRVVYGYFTGMSFGGFTGNLEGGSSRFEWVL